MRAPLLFAVVILASGATAQVGVWAEAEDATLSGVRVATTAPGFSGTGYVTDFNLEGDRVQFAFDVPPGLYTLTLRFATPHGQKGFDLEVADVASSGMFPGTGGAFAEHDAGSYRLPGGPVSVVVGKGWGYFHLDAARLSPASVTPPTVPTDGLSDPEASPSARALFRFLRDEYGRHVLSGQQSMGDLLYVEQTTGRVPAVGAFDLMRYSPSRVERGEQPETTPAEMAAWAGDRGVVSLSWHWNAPTDLLDTPDHEWWRGFYTHATTFDLEDALRDPASEDYQLLLRDIDAIAVQLGALAEADVPVLWRPLHEAAGGWFWWGTKGPEPLKQLWRLMHDRLTTVHGLHNLIWVFTTQGNDEDWYPGDDVVDIVGRDTYGEGSPAANQRTEWNETQQTYDGRKLVALTEAGGLHDPANSREFGVWWSWFSVWRGQRIRDTPVEDLRAVYADDLVLTRDELPSWRSAAVAVSDPLGESPALSVSVFPTPTSGLATARIDLEVPSDVALSVFDVTGRQVLRRSLGPLAEGTHNVPLDTSSLPAGLYIVRLDVTGSPSGSSSTTGRLVVVR